MEEKFCLRWNDFENNISNSFRELRNDKDFFDVTLACEDNQLQAHKVILSACSPWFREILKKNPHPHPLLYLKSVKYDNVLSVLNFMYHGEVNIAQDDLNSFLAVAEDLQVKGLTQGTRSTSSQPPKPPDSPIKNPLKKMPEISNEYKSVCVDDAPVRKEIPVKIKTESTIDIDLEEEPVVESHQLVETTDYSEETSAYEYTQDYQDSPFLYAQQSNLANSSQGTSD